MRSSRSTCTSVRGRSRVTAVALCLAVVATLAPREAAVATPWSPPWRHTMPDGVDWVLATATSKNVHDLDRAFYAGGRWTGPGPLVVGIAEAVRGGTQPSTWTYVVTEGGGDVRAETQVGPSHLGVTLRRGDDGRFFVMSRPSGHARTIAALAFVENGVIERVHWRRDGGWAHARDRLRYGRGTTALHLTRSTLGAAAATGSVGGGVATWERTPRRGIVGGVTLFDCASCAGTWTAPGRPATAWAQQRHEPAAACWCPIGTTTAIETQFAGPAGPWEWTWTGVASPHAFRPLQHLSHPTEMLYRPVTALYAPVGRDWRLFAATGGDAR